MAGKLTSEQARAMQQLQGAYFTEEQIEMGLMALIAWAGNARGAARYLEAEKDFKIRAQTLHGWKQKYAIRYDEMREKYAAQMEATLAHEFRDVAMQATQLERLAMEKAEQRLKAGKDMDPSRSAANFAKVAQSSTDKLMTITQRPTQITENRNVGEILRSLAAQGVIRIPEAVEADEGE